MLLVSAPWLTGQWLPTHDGLAYPFRLAEFHGLLSGGALHPRWCWDFHWGEGYPFFVFYPPGLFYLASGLRVLGLPVTWALAGATLAGNALLFAGAWRFCRLWVRAPLWAAAGALVATLAPYRFVQLTVRGDLSEALATACVPWLLAEAVLLLRGAGRMAVGRLALWLAATIVAHTLTGVIACAALACVGGAAAWGRDPRAFLRVAGAGAIGLATSAFYWVPAFFERRYVQVERLVAGDYRIADHFVGLLQRFDPRFGYGFSVPGEADLMSFASGAVVWVLVGFAALRTWREPGLRRRLAPLWIAWGAVNVMVLGVSAPLWTWLPWVEFLQFPWRLLLLEGVLAAPLCAVACEGVAVARRPQARIAAVLLVGALAVAWLPLEASPIVVAALRGGLAHAAHVGWAWPWALVGVLVLGVGFAVARARPGASGALALVAITLAALPLALLGMLRASYEPLPLDPRSAAALEDPTGLAGLTFRDTSTGARVPVTTALENEWLPLTAKRATLRRPGFEVRGRRVGGGLVEQSGHLRRYRVVAAAPTSAEFAVLHYPGLLAEIDGVPAAVAPSENGFVAIDVSEGRHDVEIRYAGTPLHTAAAALSALGSILALTLSVPRRPG